MRRRRFTVLLLLLFGAALLAPLMLWLNGSTSRATASAADQVTGNRLAAASLDIEIGTDMAIFNVANMAPGDTAIGSLRLTNAGTLPLRYDITAEAEAGPLRDWLLFDLWLAPACDAPLDTTLASVTLQADRTPLLRDGTLEPDEDDLVCIAATLVLSAPNDAQRQSMNLALVIDAEHDLDQQ